MSQLVHRSSLLQSALTLSFIAALASSAHAATITGLTVTPAEARAGTSVSATAAGSGFCGAVNIDWGDGEAITYATSTLPVTQSHVYQRGGTFTLRAQGMGNCDGQATAVVTITAPPAAPPPPPVAAPAPRLSAIELSPPGAAPRTPVTITLQGTGSCRVAVDFGDGNAQDLTGALPLSVRHTYALAGSYAIVATPATSCGDRLTATLAVGTTPKAPHLVGIEVTVAPGAGGMRTIKVTGDGPCAYTLDYGDGNTEARNGALPDVVRHNYAAAGRYTIITTAAPPCTGVLRSTNVIGAGPGGRVSRVDTQPRTASPGQVITVAIGGSGTCRFTVDFGDRQSREMTEALPHRLSYRYEDRGDYEILVRSDPPCTGDVSTALRVRGR
jgi:hypothetical protein